MRRRFCFYNSLKNLRARLLNTIRLTKIASASRYEYVLTTGNKCGKEKSQFVNLSSELSCWITLLVFFIGLFVLFIVLQNILIDDEQASKLENIVYYHENDNYISPNKKYVRYECVKGYCGGWADRLKGIMATYAFSILTNRTFLLKMTQPCRLEEVLLPNKVNWLEPILQGVEDINTSHKNTRRLSMKTLDIDLKYDLMKTYAQLRFNDLLLEADLIVIRARIMFSDAFAHNSNLHARFNELGLNHSEFFIRKQMFNWYQRLFRLSEPMTRDYGQLLRRAKPTPSTTLICVQIRIGSTSHGFFSDAYFMSRKQTKDYWKIVRNEIIDKQRMPTGSYRLFVTSDLEDVKQEADNEFGKEIVVYNEASSVHMDLDGSSCDHLDKIILDFHMLQNCDYSVISHSGFGIMGTWNRPNPERNVYVYTQRDQNKLKENIRDRKDLTFIRINDFENDLFFI